MSLNVNVRRRAFGATLLTSVLAALVGVSLFAAPVQAQTKSKPPVKKSAAKKKPVAKPTRKRSSSTARRSDALRRLKDYNYVKSMSPYAGSPNKWGSKW